MDVTQSSPFGLMEVDAVATRICRLIVKLEALGQKLLIRATVYFNGPPCVARQLFPVVFPQTAVSWSLEPSSTRPVD